MMFDITPCVGKTNLDCGPTCLRMLLLAAGTDVPLEQLTEECGIGFSGCTGADLLRVGRAHGLDMQSFSIDVEELVRQDRPAIVHWQHKHWVVFDGLDEDGRVWICNPSRGRYRVGYDTFAKLATGLADHSGQCVAIFNGEPHDNGEPEPVTVSDLADAMVDISVAVSDNADAIADLSEVVSDLAGGDING